MPFSVSSDVCYWILFWERDFYVLYPNNIYSLCYYE